ncbi:MAG: hypothetical protein KAS71_01340 [Bacteroidales bacterium]|nr:hypothetical protein [Bacteroidales bacterium]
MKIFNSILFISIVVLNIGNSDIKADDLNSSKTDFTENYVGNSSELMDTIELDNPNIIVSGSNYTQRTRDTIHFQRFSDELLAMSLLESRLNAVKAHTTTGIVISFKTDSPVIQMQFTVMEGENRGHNFALYQDGVFTKEFSFSSTAGPDLIMDFSSQSPGNEVLYEISMPNWSITSLTGLKLEEGYDLSDPDSLNKAVYVAYGNSITHGTGQAGTYKTYPFLVSEDMDYELFNLAVGGAKTSVAVAQMLRDDFEQIDVLTMLIGYNDYNGEGIDTIEYRSRYMQFLRTFREVHDSTSIHCLSMTYTTNTISVKTGISSDDFRAVVRHIVAELNAEGDHNIFFIEGDEISSELNLNDVVHFSEEGALLFAGDLSRAISKLDPDPVPVPDPDPATIINNSSRYGSIKLVPEPGQNSLYIESDLPIDSVSIFSIDGKFLFKESCDDYRVDISSISKGKYILQVEFKSREKGKNSILFFRI